MIGLDIGLVRRTVNAGNRIDGRKPDEYRDINIETGVVSSAEGSARVTIGDTIVIAGVKMAIGEPFSDTPNEGVLIVSGEFLPLADPYFEAGPPREDPIELSRLVDRAIRESKAIDMGKLCISAGEKVWMINVDIDIMNNDGNLIDASSIATAAALLSTKIPLLDEEGKIIYDSKGTESLPMKGIPLCTTFVKIGESILIDPSAGECEALDARLTVGTLDRNKLCSMQKNGSSGLYVEDIDRMISLAQEKSQMIREMINKSAK